MLDFLSENIYCAVKPYFGKNLSELRIRADKPLFALVDGRFIGIKGEKPSKGDIEKIIIRLTRHSVYCYEEVIRRGYLMGGDGERVGIVGDCVTDNGVRYIKNITSLCIRVPFEAVGCAKKVADELFYQSIKSVLVISPPGAGKTTFLRDLSRITSDEYGKNVLVIDEKGELSGSNFDLGKRSDVLKFSGKDFGLKYGVLNMRPDVIVIDEISEEREAEQVENAVLSGVKVFASVHGESIDDVKTKRFMRGLFTSKVFDCTVTLTDKEKAGTVSDVYVL